MAKPTTRHAQRTAQLLTETNLLLLATVLRVLFFLYGLHQDRTMPIPYTDIDYLVFTDAAQFVTRGLSPYLRDTYRYTPLLAWLLTPCWSWGFQYGKFLFIVCDLVTGLIILKLLNGVKSERRKLALASIWLLNPMVITISTRGSSECVLCVFVMMFVMFLECESTLLAGFFAGLSVHFKIYPVIYIPTAVLYLSRYVSLSQLLKNPLLLVNANTLRFAVYTLGTFIGFSAVMYYHYGYEFLEHSYIYHLSRTDHRHNFSVYNISLYFTSSGISPSKSLDFTKLAFIPQLFISAVIIPLFFTKRNLVKTLFLQTFSFVMFNKVITSQYFIWFLIFLPFYLSDSKFLTTHKTKGLICLILWVGSQAFWLFEGYELEFLGKEVFVPGLLGASVLFFLSNVYVLGEFINDA